MGPSDSPGTEPSAPAVLQPAGGSPLRLMSTSVHYVLWPTKGPLSIKTLIGGCPHFLPEGSVDP